MVTLPGSLTGFVSAAFPDLLKIRRDAADREHELAIREMQMAQAAQGSPATAGGNYHPGRYC